MADAQQVVKKQIIKITGEVALEGTVVQNAGALTAIGASVEQAQDAIRNASPLTKDFVLLLDVEDVKPPRKPRAAVPAAAAPAAQQQQTGDGNKAK